MSGPGGRRTVLLVPGLMCDDDLYAEQLPALSGTVDVLVSDVSRSATIGEMAAAALAVAPDSFALAGLSMGGYVAWEVLRQAPERITGLALLDTSARPETEEQTARRRALLELGATAGFPAVLDVLWPFEVAPSRRDDTALRARMDAMGLRAGAETFARQQEAIIGRADSRPQLGQVDVPTLVLCGRQDVITPLDGHEEMAAGIPDADLVVLGDCGHLSTWERPDEVTRALLGWLAR